MLQNLPFVLRIKFVLTVIPEWNPPVIEGQSKFPILPLPSSLQADPLLFSTPHLNNLQLLVLLHLLAQ